MMNEEMKQILNLSNEEKYDYFIKKVVETQKVWALRTDEGYASLQDEYHLFFPVWPEKEYADQCISENWTGYRSESIALDDLMERWLQGLSEDDIRLTLFWMDGKGIEVSTNDLLEDLEEELGYVVLGE